MPDEVLDVAFDFTVEGDTYEEITKAAYAKAAEFYRDKPFTVNVYAEPHAVPAYQARCSASSPAWLRSSISRLDEPAVSVYEPAATAGR